MLAALAVVALAGCSADPATPVTPGPTASVTTAAPSATPSSATPTPSPSPSPEASSASPTPGLSGAESETYANDLEVADDGQVSFTPLRWYQGQRAENRCEKVGISSPTAWCHDYYFEKAGPASRATLTEDTGIKLLGDDAELRTAGAAQFRQAVADEAWPNFRLWLVGNEIRRVEQVYTP